MDALANDYYDAYNFIKYFSKKGDLSNNHLNIKILPNIEKNKSKRRLSSIYTKKN